MTADQAKGLVARLGEFFRPKPDDELVNAYVSKLVSLPYSQANKAVELWIDEKDHWPAWAELRKAVHARTPRSLGEQDEKRPKIVEQTERELMRELERKSHAETDTVAIGSRLDS